VDSRAVEPAESTACRAKLSQGHRHPEEQRAQGLCVVAAALVEGYVELQNLFRGAGGELRGSCRTAA
jgi:hypothetical protein